MSTGSKCVVGIIGGTGIDQDPNLISSKKLIDLKETPYGWASDRQAISGLISGVEVFILARHGRNHDVSPSHVNYRANLWTLVEQLKCTHILVTSACGSLKEELKPGDIGVLDQYIDRTVSFRNRSFYKVIHVSQRSPIDSTLQKLIAQSCDELKLTCHQKLTAVTIEGPRFSTLAESNLHRSWGCDVVNMTSVPEVQLAGELGVIYAAIMLITDYDCWKSEDESVNADLVVQRMKDLGSKARKIIPLVIEKIAQTDWVDIQKYNTNNLKNSIMYK